MIPLAFSALLLGSALGMRFKVLVLIPALAVAFAAIAAIGLVDGNSIATIAIATVVAAFCLQVGYLAGAIVLGGAASQAKKPSLQPGTAR